MKKFYIILLMFSIPLLIKSQDTISCFHKVKKLDYEIIYSRYDYNFCDIFPTSDGGSILYFYEYLYDFGDHTYIAKTDRYGQIEWLKNMDSNIDKTVFVYNGAIVNNDNTVFVTGQLYGYNAESTISKIDLSTGDILKSWNYPDEYNPELFEFKRINNYFYFTSLENKAFMRTDTNFVENLYCEAIDTSFDSSWTNGKFFITSENAICINRNQDYKYDDEPYYTFIQVFDLECNVLWEKRIHTNRELKYLIGGSNIYLFFPNNIMEVLDIEGNLILSENTAFSVEYGDIEFDINRENEKYKTVYNKWDNKTSTFYCESIIYKTFGQDTIEYMLIKDDIGQIIDIYSIGDTSYHFMSVYKKSLYSGILHLDNISKELFLDTCIVQKIDDVDDFNESEVPFLYYPNPVVNTLNIKVLDCDRPIENMEFKSLIGIIEYSSNDTFCEKDIDLSYFDSGVHLLLITIEGKVYTKKIVIL